MTYGQSDPKLLFQFPLDVTLKYELISNSGKSYLSHQRLIYESRILIVLFVDNEKEVFNN